MIERTTRVLFFTSIGFVSLRTRQCFIMLWMILSFFSSMSFFAVFSVYATFGVMIDEVTRLPVQTSYRVIKVSIRLSSVVLPVMRINTKRFVMSCQVIGAPDSLIVKHIKIIVKGKIMDELDLYILFAVGKRAIVAIFAF